jgi:acylphosphatase
MSERVARRLRLHGRVQGVWFRESMRRKALTLEVTGWVRNRMDGTVEAVIEGEPGAVEEMTDWARHGPERAEVRKLEQFDESPVNFTAFETRPTA